MGKCLTEEELVHVQGPQLSFTYLYPRTGIHMEGPTLLNLLLQQPEQWE